METNWIVVDHLFCSLPFSLRIYQGHLSGVVECKTLTPWRAGWASGALTPKGVKQWGWGDQSHCCRCGSEDALNRDASGSCHSLKEGENLPQVRAEASTLLLNPSRTNQIRCTLMSLANWMVNTPKWPDCSTFKAVCHYTIKDDNLAIFHPRGCINLLWKAECCNLFSRLQNVLSEEVAFVTCSCFWAVGSSYNSGKPCLGFL